MSQKISHESVWFSAPSPLIQSAFKYSRTFCDSPSHFPPCSHPQEVPGSPILPHNLSSSSAGFRYEANVDISLHDIPPSPGAASHPLLAKELISTRNAKSSRDGVRFPSPISQPLFSEQLDPSLHSLLGCTVSPAVAASPNREPRFFSSITSLTPLSASLSSPPVGSAPNLTVEGEVFDGADDSGPTESSSSANFGVPLVVGPEGADSFSEMVGW